MKQSLLSSSILVLIVYQLWYMYIMIFC